MENKSHLTNESLNKKFKSNFELVNYAIRLAANMIDTGRDPRVKSDNQNRALLILEEIDEGKDQFDQVPERPSQERGTSGSKGQADGSHSRADIIEEKFSVRRSSKFSFSDDGS